jgi:hypothetical protein
MPERMIEAGHANAAHHHTGGAPLVGGATGQGTMMRANAVSEGSHPAGIPHGRAGKALTGTIDGAKKSMAAINAVLTILRMFIFAPEARTGTDSTK